MLSQTAGSAHTGTIDNDLLYIKQLQSGAAALPLHLNVGFQYTDAHLASYKEESAWIDFEATIPEKGALRDRFLGVRNLFPQNPGPQM